MSMYKKTFTDLLHSTNNTCCYNYVSPVGEIMLLGNDESLCAIQFKQEQQLTGLNNIPRKKTASIESCITVLDAWFRNKNSNEKLARKHIALKALLLKTEKQLKMSCAIDAKKIVLSLDLAPFTEKEQAVYDALLKVPAGKSISYNELAVRAGFPGAARFVGTTMAKNLFPIIIPCHRVIKSDGSLGNYSGGVEKKKYLLAIESEN